MKTRDLDEAIIALGLLFIAIMAFAVQECDPSPAAAQDVPALSVPDVQLPVTGEILALERGDRAEHAGMLILDEDLVAWRHAIERLTYQLAAQAALSDQTLVLRLDQERARTSASEERVALRDELWRARVAELTTALAASQGREGPAWYEQPLLWTVVGAILGGAVVGLVASALH